MAAGWVWPKKSEHTDTVDTAVRQVEIDNGSGDVIVRSADVSHTVVKQRFSYRGGDPERAFEVAGSTLLLHGCGSFCSVDYEVTVPVGTTVRGEVSSGDVVVEGTADVDVRASSGDVKLRLRDANNVSVEAKSGNVSADLDGVAKVDANTRSGSMDLDLKGSTSFGPRPEAVTSRSRCPRGSTGWRLRRTVVIGMSGGTTRTRIECSS